MKIAIAQINTKVGDIKGNAAKVKKYMSRAYREKVDLVIFPELALSGYPPLDLMMNQDFISANLEELEKLAKATWHPACIIGFIDLNPSAKGKPLLNSAAFLHKGKIVAKRSKTLLPTYDVFDESRFFEPSTKNQPVEFQRKKIAITVCEDLLGEMEVYEKRKLYRVSLIKSFSKSRPDLIINISASPYWQGKDAERKKILSKTASKVSAPLIYVNSVGANDEIIFDGNSFAVSSNGKIVFEAESFRENLVCFDLAELGRSKEETKSDKTAPESEIVEALTLGIRDFFIKQGFSRAVVGISGGIDSAVCAAIAARALGAENVIGVLMPSKYTSKETKEDAEKLCHNLGIRKSIIPISAMHKVFDEALFGEKKKEISVPQQNIQARVRGNIIMALANKNGWLPLAAGNKSEIAVGYSTLYGDTAGALAPISDVLKTQIYKIAAFLNRERELIPKTIITRPPTAELKPDQRDEDELGSYEILDKIIRQYVEENKTAEDIIAGGIPRKTVYSVIKRIEGSEYKRKQIPLGLKISKKSFGLGRRMPIVKDISFTFKKQ